MSFGRNIKFIAHPINRGDNLLIRKFFRDLLSQVLYMGVDSPIISFKVVSLYLIQQLVSGKTRFGFAIRTFNRPNSLGVSANPSL